jgi:hypothetical protein
MRGCRHARFHEDDPDESSDSIRMGSCRTLCPVAWNTALAIARAVPTSEISPSP